MFRVGNYCLCVQSEETHVTSIPGVMSRMCSSLPSAEKGRFCGNADLKSCLVSGIMVITLWFFVFTQISGHYCNKERYRTVTQ